MRFRLLELGAVIGVCAFAVASLTQLTEVFECLFVSLTFSLTLAAMLLSIARRGAARAFWLGFAATSFLYLAFANVSGSGGMGPRIKGPDVPTQVLRSTFNWLFPIDGVRTFSPDKELGGFFSVQDKAASLGDSQNTLANPFGSDFEGEALSEVVPYITRAKGSSQRQLGLPGVSAFFRIGHSAWALLLAWIAGHFTRSVYNRSRQQPTPATG